MSDGVDLFGNKVPPEKTYWVEPDKELTAASLRTADRETQIKVMETWFYGRYEDPADNTPYIDGAYQFIHGGPFNPRDELENEFSGIVADEVVEEVIGSIEGFGDEWAPRGAFDYDDYLVDSIDV